MTLARGSERVRRASALLVALAALQGCDDGTPAPDAPRWSRLAEGFRPAAARGRWAATFGGTHRLELAPHPDEHGVWATVELVRGDWRRSEHFPDAWQLLRPLAPEGVPGTGGTERLVADGRALEYVPFTVASLGHPETVPAPSFSGVLDQLYLKLRPGEAPPERATYSVFVSRGRARDGVWRVSMGRYQCDGLPVWTGHPETVDADVPPDSVLRFATIAVASSARARGDATTRFRVRVGDETLFEHVQSVSDLVAATRHEVRLPQGIVGPRRFVFEVDGPAALTAFGVPVIGPARTDAEGGPPDLILFVADTFRADNMRLYGGERGVTPRLDALAEHGVAFTRAWSPAPWTLPAQASMLSGLAPYQHGATNDQHGLAEEAWTLAEHLSDGGYRTAAVTDAAFLSQRFAMDQGFEWFDELPDDKLGERGHESLERTLERVDGVLAADDGRPLFLWVQTYRVHFPYVVSERTREEWADRLELAHWEDTAEAVQRSGWSQGQPVPESLDPVARAMRELYLGGVVDFDRAFGSWVRAHEAAGRFADTVLVFTSDHGEAFAEHDDLYHGAGVWESQVRVPLFLFGGGLEPQTVDHSATLVDLPRTLSDLAGLEPFPRWGGASLLELAADRPVVVVESSTYPNAAQALIEGERKVIAALEAPVPAEDDLREAYDLDADPGEERDLLARPPAPPWATAMVRALGPRAGELRQTLLPEAGVRLSPDERARLEALGYTDDDPDEAKNGDDEGEDDDEE